MVRKRSTRRGAALADENVVAESDVVTQSGAQDDVDTATQTINDDPQITTTSHAPATARPSGVVTSDDGPSRETPLGHTKVLVSKHGVFLQPAYKSPYGAPPATPQTTSPTRPSRRGRPSKITQSVSSGSVVNESGAIGSSVQKQVNESLPDDQVPSSANLRGDRVQEDITPISTTGEPIAQDLSIDSTSGLPPVVKNTPKRRGRPPKQRKVEAVDKTGNQSSIFSEPTIEDEASTPSIPGVEATSAGASNGKRRRRPSAKIAANISLTDHDLDISEDQPVANDIVQVASAGTQLPLEQIPPKKKRGRPRKSTQPASSTLNDGVTAETPFISDSNHELAKVTPTLIVSDGPDTQESAADPPTTAEANVAVVPDPVPQSKPAVKRGRKRTRIEVQINEGLPEPKRLAVDNEVDTSQPLADTSNEAEGGRRKRRVSKINYAVEALPAEVLAIPLDDDDDENFAPSTRPGKKPTVGRKRQSNKRESLKQRTQMEALDPGNQNQFENSGEINNGSLGNESVAGSGSSDHAAFHDQHALALVQDLSDNLAEHIFGDNATHGLRPANHDNTNSNVPPEEMENNSVAHVAGVPNSVEHARQIDDSFQKPSMDLPRPSLLIILRLPPSVLQEVSLRPERRITLATIGWANRRKMAAEVTEKLAEANRIQMFAGTSRLACSIQSVPGNLILSADQECIEFWALKQHPPEMPMFSLRTSDVEKDPNVSPRSANPITIRFKARDTWRGAGQQHAFIVPQNDDGYRAMLDFRERIVQARSVVVYEREATPEGEIGWVLGAKPFRCDKCQVTFKNKNGLEYHLEKSQTACNPNFVPVEKPIKEKIPRARKKDKARSEANEIIRPKRTKKKRDAEEEEKDDAEANASDSSVDSIYEWAQQVASTEKAETSTSTRKRHKAFHGENELLRELALMPIQEIYPSLGDGTVATPEAQNVINITPKICRHVIIDLVNKNGGLFPGDKSAWFAVVNAWLLNYKTPDSLAGSKLCNIALDDLVETEKLQKVEFTFRDKRSRDVTRRLFLAADYAGGEDAITELKASISNAHPKVYVPEAFAPPAVVSDKLQNLVTRPSKAPAVPTAIRTLDVESTDSDIDSDLEKTSEDSDDDMSLDGMADEITREIDRLLAAEVAAEVAEDEKTGKPRRPKKKKKGRAADAISAGVIAWHVKRRAEGLEGPLTKKTIKRHERLAAIISERETAKKEKELARRAYEESGAWRAPPRIRLQNIETGAWNVKQAKRQKRSDPYETSKARSFGVGFPESITLLQNENGAWSNRAFGHGVKPIFARPSKRHDMSSYLRTLRKGFRPVVIPDQYVEAEKQRQEQLELEGPTPKVKKPRRRKSVKIVPPVEVQEDNSDGDFVPADEGPEEDDIGNFSGDPLLSSRESSTQVAMGPANPSTYFFNPGSRKNRGRIRRSGARKAKAEHAELDMLSQNQGGIYSQRNPGLNTLPPFFGVLQNPAIEDTDFDNFETYTHVKFVESDLVTTESTFEEGSWLLLWSTGKKQHLAYDSIRFDRRTNLTVESLPYYNYERSEREDQEEEEEDAKRQKLSDQLQRVNPHITMVGTSKYNKIARIKRLIPTRPLTAIEADFDGLTEQPIEIGKKLGVEVLPTPAGEYQRKRLRLGNKMNASDITMFLVAIVVVRVLTGGIDQFVDWIIVQTLFPDYSLNYLDKVWRSVIKYKEKEELLDELGVNFQDAFLVAYQNGTLPKLDYDNLLEYNWSKLVKWTMKNVDTSFAPKIHQLTAKRADMEEEYFSTVRARDWSEAQTMYFHSSAPIYRRQDAAASANMSINIDEQASHSPTYKLNEGDVIRSWARAAALTPVEMWNSKLAFVKLTQYHNDLLEEAITDLVEQKVIIKRSRQRHITGRAYEGSDFFVTPLRKPIPATMLVEAIEYKELLDSKFSSGEVVEVDYMGDDGSYMCISNLQACGQLIITEFDVPMEPMGLGNDLHPYDTKRLPKTKIKWKMQMRPSASYIYNEDNDLLETVKTVPPPLPEGSQALPVWYTILVELFPEMWKRVLCAVCATITQRIGISTKGLQQVFTPTLEPWELDMLLRWGHGAGLWQPIDDDETESDDDMPNVRVDGWRSTPGWWILAGSIMREMDVQTARFKARHEELKASKERAKANGNRAGNDEGDEDEMDLDTPTPDADAEGVDLAPLSSGVAVPNSGPARIFAGHMKIIPIGGEPGIGDGDDTPEDGVGVSGGVRNIASARTYVSPYV